MTEPSAGAVRAADKIFRSEGVRMMESPKTIRDFAQIIDEQTGLPELTEALEEIIKFIEGAEDAKEAPSVASMIRSALAKSKGVS